MVADMADHHDRTPGEVAGMIANPFYAITIDAGLTLPHEPMISEDDWIKANVDTRAGSAFCADAGHLAWAVLPVRSRPRTQLLGLRPLPDGPADLLLREGSEFGTFFTSVSRSCSVVGSRHDAYVRPG
jgi:hypothetical protein